MEQKDRSKKREIPVKDHPLQVPVSAKNPSGVTIRDQHIRRIKGTYLDLNEFEQIFKNYNRKSLIYPSKGKLVKYKDSDLYDEQIAVWVDYFNTKFNLDPKLDANMVKALIASESSFKPEARNKNALGLTQITKDTLKILQDPKGEVKDFTFDNIRQKDLKNPNVSIPLAVRWLAQKQKLAAFKLKRAPTSDEIIMEYKGILKDKSKKAQKIMQDYRGLYEKLNK